MMRRPVALLRLILLVVVGSGLLPTSVYAQASEAIPDFCASVTKTANTGSFNWSSTSAWVGATVPNSTSDKVVIPSGATITYDASSTTSLKSVCVRSGGTLQFATSSTTKLTLNELQVDMGGTLKIGDGTTAINAANTAEVVFDCVALDVGTVMTPGTDPEQFGCGLLVMGTFRAHGATKTSWVRLAATPTASSTSLTLASTVTGWVNSTDEVVVPDTRQLIFGGGGTDDPPFTQGGSFMTRTEKRTLSSVSGTAVTLSSALTYTHPCGLNQSSVCEYYPHVMNITRNVLIRSVSSGATVRGHTMFHHMADVDVEYVEFKDLGRTTNNYLHCTYYATGGGPGTGGDSNGRGPDGFCNRGTGTLSQIGTNQIGRYPVHFHRMMGPTNVSNTGYQGTFIGNSIINSKKWPLTVHSTSYLDIEDNVIWDGFGGGVVLENGDEWFNKINHNFVVGMHATTSAIGPDCSVSPYTSSGDCGDPFHNNGREAIGFWSRGGLGNYWTNNASAANYNFNQQINTDNAFKFFEPPSQVGVAFSAQPNYRGADISTAGQYTNVDNALTSMLQFDSNEGYGAMGAAFTVWNSGSDCCTLVANMPTSTISNFVCWNIYENCLFFYPAHAWTVDGLTARGDPARRNIGAGGYRPIGIYSGDYQIDGDTFANLNIQNFGTGVAPAWGWDGDLTVRDSYIHALYGIDVTTFDTYGGANRAAWANRTLTLSNVTFGSTISGSAITTMRKRVIGRGAYTTCPGGSSPFCNFGLSEMVTFINYNGTGLTFDVYYNEQATDPSIGGGTSPCADTTTHPEIDAITCNPRGSGGKRFGRLRGVFR